MSGQRLELDRYGIVIYNGTNKDLQITSGRTSLTNTDTYGLYDSDFFPSGIVNETTSGRIILGDGSLVPRTTLSNTGINLFTSDTTCGEKLMLYVFTLMKEYQQRLIKKQVFTGRIVH